MAINASSNRMPSSIPYIIGNEAAERFSFYGMRAILFIFMTKYLMDHNGNPDHLTEPQAKYWYHLFVSSAYFFPLLGGLLSDIFWGKYKTIFWLSLIYCLGHLCLALDDTRMGLTAGLTLIAIGSGGIKPCVSALVGDQFDKSNETLIERVFSYFYLAINFGAFFSQLAIPLLLEYYGPKVAFAVPGVLMLLAALIFWLGRKKYVVSKPVGAKEYFSAFKDKEAVAAILKLCVLYLFVAVFWSLYDQNGASWVEQAESPLMDKEFNFLGMHINVLASQIQSVNAILILILTPLFSFVVYPVISRMFPLNHMRKIGIGLFIASTSFMLIAWIEGQLAAGHHMSFMWQVLAYFILTASEVMVSITSLEFSYVSAPPKMKSFVMGLYLLSVSLGNLFAAGVNGFITGADGKPTITGPQYFWFFALLMLATSVVFIFFALVYKTKIYVAENAAPDPYVSEN